MNKSVKLTAIASTIIILIVAFANVQPATSKPGQKPGKPEHVADVIILEVREGVNLEEDEKGNPNHKFKTDSPELDAALDALGVHGLKPLFPPGQAKKAQEDSGNAVSLTRVYRLKLKPNTDVEAAVAVLSAVPGVMYAEPDYIAESSGMSNAITNPAPVSVNQQIAIDDPLYGVQWGLTKMNIEGAWDDTYGSSTVTIAIVDSGIDLSPHVDLNANLWINPGEIAGNGIDDDSNGFIDDVNGWNFVAGSNDVWDDNGHGTLVAGVAAAVGGNGQGIVGVCPQCRIMPVKVMQASGVVNYSDIANGVLYAAQKGAKVINLSLGGYANSNTLRNAINTAVNTYGVVIVAGAGNDNLSTPFYPAAYDNVLAVAGTAEDDTKVGFSNYGTWVDISGPAINVRTTALGGDWANGSGTSVASPFAAGLAGLLISLHPDWNQATIRSQIVHTADNIDGANPALVGMLGAGRLNAGAAMQAPHPILSMAGYAINGQTNGRPVLGTAANLTITLNNDWWDAAGVTGTLSTADAYITMINNTATFGDIAAGTSKANTTDFTFTVDSGAGYNHPIPFTLDVTDTSGYSNSYNFTVNTESGIENKSGTIGADTIWTNDKTYLIFGDVGIAPGYTLIIQPGTTVKFNGNYSLNVGGTLIADGTSTLPIHFMSNNAGTWNHIFFDNPSVDAVADVDGNYTSGSILRYVNIESASSGIDCTTATPYLSHVTLNSGGVVCSLGATPIWFLDNTITGASSFTGTGKAYRNTVFGDLSISGAGTAEDNILNGRASLSLGSGFARRNTVRNGGLTVAGNAGSIENNTVSGGNVSAGTSFSVLNNTIGGSLTTENNATVDHNTASNGITVGASSTVTWNNVENANGTGLIAGTNVTAQYNRLIGNAIGMTAITGLIEHNLIANNKGVGLQVGAATVRYNTFTGNQGSTILVQDGTPVTIEYNNLEGNTGTYDLYVNIASGVFVSAQNNWWGTTDNTVIPNRIFDFNVDYTKANVTFLPKLSSPDQTAPGYVRSVAILPDTTLGIQTGTFEIQFSRPMDSATTPQTTFERAAGFIWATRASMPTARQDLGVVTASNGKIYAIAGYWYITAVEEYDPIADTWTARASMPTARWNLGVTATSNGKIYAIGGNVHSPIYRVATVEEYDPATDTWTARASMPTARGDLGVATASNGKIYAIGGDGMNTVEEYDPITNTWATKASMPTARGGLGVVAASNGKIYAIGGGGGMNTVEEYDPITDTWTTKANMPTARRNLGIATASNGKIYAIGGDGGMNTVEEYDPATDIWRTYASGMPTARRHLGVATASNGRIYAIGGTQGGPYNIELATVEEATLPFEATGFYNPQWASNTQYRASYDITSAVPKDTYRVTVNDAVDPDGMRVAPFSNTTFNVDYAGFISDKTPPTQPIVTANGDGSLTTLSASWSSSDPESTITKYRYAIGTSPGARDVVAWTYTDDTSVTRANLNLTFGVTYYISVGARNEGGLWSESGVSNGITIGAFNKTSPLSGAVNQLTHPTLSWSASTGATSYEYCYDTTNDNVCSAWVNNGAATSKPLNNLSPNTIYYWHVRAVRGGSTAYSNASNTAYWSFTTGKPPNAFNKISPLNGATAQPTTVSLSWQASADAVAYEYCYNTTNTCTAWANNGTATTKVLSGLSYDTTYYWHVRAVNSNDTVYSNGSNIAFWSFTTGHLPGSFNKITPANLSTNIPVNPSLNWEASVDAVSYEYCIGKTKTNCTNWINVGNQTFANPSTLLAGTNYYWNVRAKNTVDITYSNGASSAVWLFQTVPVVKPFYSAAANDGWILESKELSNFGGSMSASETLRVGDDARKRQYRSVLSFDTSDIPNNAVVSKATLRIYKSGDVAPAPFTAIDNLLADIKKGCFGLCPLQPADFSAAAEPVRMGKFTNIGGWYQLNISPLQLKYINLLGVTQFRLRFKLDDNNDKTANYVIFDSGGDGHPPELIVEYTLP